MTELVRVRVAAHRSLSLNSGEGLAACSTLHQAGDELELSAAEAAQLELDGYVEKLKT